MKWLRYQTVISLQTQVGVTSQRNKWANMEPRTCQRWDHVSWGCKHPLWTGHTRRNHKVLRCLSKSVYQVRSSYWYEKCQTTHASMKVCNSELDHCNGHKTCQTLTSNETVEIPVTSTFLLVVYPDSKYDRMYGRPLYIESVERYIRHMQVIVGCCYMYMGS
jgi:hypothetical protein